MYQLSTSLCPDKAKNWEENIIHVMAGNVLLYNCTLLIKWHKSKDGLNLAFVCDLYVK